MGNSTLFLIFVLGLVLVIPTVLEDVLATTFGVAIPVGAADIKRTMHYTPSHVTASVGDFIQWHNYDSTTHTVTSGSFQGGPDGIFNSGLLEPNDDFLYEPTIEDIGTMSYFCTLHPWMNGIITVKDPEGLSVGRVAESGSSETAKNHILQADQRISEAKGFSDSAQYLESAESYSEAAHHYHQAALQYALLDDNKNAALFHHESGIQHHNAAIQYEKEGDFGKSVLEHFEAGVHHHFAAIQYGILDDQEKHAKHLSESLLHKRMAKYGSDYVLPPKHQAKFMTTIDDISCKEGFELVLKSTTTEPACVNPSSSAKLIQRGWAKSIS